MYIRSTNYVCQFPPYTSVFSVPQEHSKEHAIIIFLNYYFSSYNQKMYYM